MADRLLQPGFALNEEGFPTTPGYAFTPVLTDAPLRARTSPLRYKEWDFYQITNPRYTLQVTLGHVSYAGAIDVVLFDYNGLRRRLTLPMILPFRKLGLAPKADAEGTVSYRDDRYAISVTTEPCRRLIEADILHSRYGACRLRLQLDYRPDDQGILVLTPFRQPRCFYHNYKQNCMTVSGFLALGDGFRADFDPSDSAFSPSAIVGGGPTALAGFPTDLCSDSISAYSATTLSQPKTLCFIKAKPQNSATSLIHAAPVSINLSASATTRIGSI